jgi:thiamine kinase-like enzyme
MSDPSQAVARLGALLGPHGTAEPLDGGITNRNYKIRFGEADYVVRMPGKDTGLLGIDRKSEWAATCAAANIGIGPPIGAMLDDPPCLVTRFVEGVPATAEQLREPKWIYRSARALHALHQSGTVLPNTFSPFRIVEDYARLATARGVELPAGYAEAQKHSRQVERALTGPDHVPVICHNDLLASNFILTPEDKLRLIDWEYTGMGDRFFDLGNFAVNNELGDAEEEILLDAYFGEPPSPRRRAALKLMRYMSDFREAMWGVLQSSVSDVDFDFTGYAGKHFERLDETASDEKRFKRWLKEARGRRA